MKIGIPDFTVHATFQFCKLGKLYFCPVSVVLFCFYQNVLATHQIECSTHFADRNLLLTGGKQLLVWELATNEVNHEM